MDYYFLRFENYTLQYQIYGKGEKLLLAFPGYNRDCSDFRVLETSLGKNYKIISFNLFYTGESYISHTLKNPTFHYGNLKGLVCQLLKEYQTDFFSVMGYSLGGKIALACIELFPDKINDVILLAPDGIKIHWVYNFACNTIIGNKLFKKMVDNPFFFFKSIAILRKIQILNGRLYNFVVKQLNSKDKRERIYKIWMLYREIIPKARRIQEIINLNNINVLLIYGKHDSIISSKEGRSFVNGLYNKNCLHILEAGHRLINEKLNSYLIDNFKNNSILSSKFLK